MNWGKEDRMKYECLPARYSFEEGHNKFSVDKNEPPSVGYISFGRYTAYDIVMYTERETHSNESTSV